VTVDEVCDPEGMIAQEDRHFAALASTQELTLKQARDLAILVDPHRWLHASPSDGLRTPGMVGA
jgi:hypothetical protein